MWFGLTFTVFCYKLKLIFKSLCFCYFLVCPFFSFLFVVSSTSAGGIDILKLCDLGWFSCYFFSGWLCFCYL